MVAFLFLSSHQTGLLPEILLKPNGLCASDRTTVSEAQVPTCLLSTTICFSHTSNTRHGNWSKVNTVGKGLSL